VNLKSILLYPPTVRLERGKLTKYYSTVCEYKPYGQFAFLPDGARLMNEAGTQLRLGPDRLAFQERIPSNESIYGTVPKTIEPGSRLVQVATGPDGAPLKVNQIRQVGKLDGNLAWASPLSVEVTTEDGQVCTTETGPNGRFAWTRWRCAPGG